MPRERPIAIDDRHVHLRGSRLARALLHVAGWRLVFDGLPTRQGVVIVYPHTSNWDLPIGLVAKWAVGADVVFWGKASIFRVPLFGAWLRWLGGIPVDRQSPKGIVGDMVARMRRARERDAFLWLALSPEGTRAYRDGWRSGFYHVAVGADVPLALAVLDFGQRIVGVIGFLRLSGDAAEDLAEIERRYAGATGRHPSLAAPVRFRDER